jgi:hypothetical protein
MTDTGNNPTTDHEPDDPTTATETRSPGGATAPFDFSKLTAKPGLLVAAGAAVVVVLFTLVYFTSLSSAKTEGVRREAALSARYQDNQNQLSSYVTSIREQLDVSDRKADRLNAVLVDAVKGRYDNELSAATPGEAPQLISALVEAYPDLAGLDSYDQVLNAVESGRARFRNAQSVLLDEIAAYEAWLNKGIWHAWIVKRAGFTSDRLEARIGDRVVTGEEALDQMKLIVTDAGTQEDFTSGQTEPLDLNPTPGGS